jgi:murein L,D-transpeptidase YafK
MTRRAALVLLFGLLASNPYSVRAGSYRAVDRCLAVAGQAWNYRTKGCEAAPAGPADRIFVDKSDHWMAVYPGGRIFREFRVALGRGGLKPKSREGDGRVPEGLYRITAHNPASDYYLSLRIGYPTPGQAAAAAERGIDPGGDIMIHGLPNGRGAVGSRHRKVDWTDGCIALTDPEMLWLYKAVPDGTPIEIRA